MSRVIIIGGGAAGLAAAVSAASCGDEVLVLERMDRVGKKLLATGNGRCNLMNTQTLRYPSGADFAAEVLKRCGPADQRRFWEGLGLRLREEGEGRVYPADAQAATVLDVLRLHLARLGVAVQTGVQVTALTREGRRWRVTVASGETWTADRVIVAGGGRAQPKLGSDGSAYALMTAQGHRLRTPMPALTQIETERKPIAGLSGIRVKCGVSVWHGGRLLHRENGEALFADYGVSGVCVMQCAQYAAKRDTSLSLCLLPDMGIADEEGLRAELQRRRTDWARVPLEQLWTGLSPARLGQALFRRAEIRPNDRVCGSLTEAEISRLTAAAAAFTLRVTGIRGFDTAQVTAGGIDTDGFDPANLASRIAPGLHAAGEVLDVDGDCGGFNLMFAFGSGILAGLNGRKPNHP